jgi:hypothetical protein
MTEKTDTPFSTTKLLELIVDLHNKEQVVTCDTLARHCNLSKIKINDRLVYLEETGKIARIQRGVYVPVFPERPSRPVYYTALPTGERILEIGDHKLIMTPREARIIGQLMTGEAMQMTNIELMNQIAQFVSRAILPKPSPQKSLF